MMRGSTASKQQPTRTEWISGVLLAACYVLGALAACAWADSRGPAIPSVIAVFQTAITLAEAATACLLLNEARDRQNAFLGLVGTAYTWSAVYAVLHLLTFPGALVPAQTVIGGPQLTSYLFNFWRLGFIALIFAAVATRKPRMWTSHGMVVPLATVGVALAVFAAIYAAEPRLPTLVDGSRFTKFDLVLSWLGVPLGLGACTWWQGRHDTLKLWLAVALTTWCGDLVVSNIAGARFTLGWYLARSSGVLSACTLFLFFISRSVVQQRAAVKAARDLRQKTVSLQLEIARRAEAEGQLIQLQKLDAIGQLTGGIAHDFNNLLAAIVGNLDLLSRGETSLGPKQARWIENALAAAERGRKLTNQLLVFARAQRLEMKPVELRESLSKARELLQRTLGPTVRIDMPDSCDLPCVLADDTQLELAILNLGLNARDAMPEGGQLHLTVTQLQASGDPELRDGEYVCIRVADSGQGMPSQVLTRALEPFFTTKPPGRGTGLGLSQVYGFARKSGGTVKLESAPGRGTRVFIYLPLAQETSMEELLPLSPEAESKVGQGSVLVVDDDPDVRSFLVDYLKQSGFDVMEASSGAETIKALARLGDDRPDLMIIDFAMPEMNGAVLAGHARSMHPDLPLIFVTGYAETAALEAVSGPPPLLLKKPFRGYELLAMVCSALEGRRGA